MAAAVMAVMVATVMAAVTGGDDKESVGLSDGRICGRSGGRGDGFSSWW